MKTYSFYTKNNLNKKIYITIYEPKKYKKIYKPIYKSIHRHMYKYAYDKNIKQKNVYYIKKDMGIWYNKLYGAKQNKIIKYIQKSEYKNLCDIKLNKHNKLNNEVHKYMYNKKASISNGVLAVIKNRRYIEKYIEKNRYEKYYNNKNIYKQSDSIINNENIYKQNSNTINNNIIKKLFRKYAQTNKLIANKQNKIYENKLNIYNDKYLNKNMKNKYLNKKSVVYKNNLNEKYYIKRNDIYKDIKKIHKYMMYQKSNKNEQKIEGENKKEQIFIQKNEQKNIDYFDIFEKIKEMMLEECTGYLNI